MTMNQNEFHLKALQQGPAAVDNVIPMKCNAKRRRLQKSNQMFLIQDEKYLQQGQRNGRNEREIALLRHRSFNSVHQLDTMNIESNYQIKELTEEEIQKIDERAKQYITSIEPDTRYLTLLMPGNGLIPANYDDKENYNGLSLQKNHFTSLTSTTNIVEIDKRQYAQQKVRDLLPATTDSTKWIKPQLKLIKMVALIIYHSPDKMLMAKQVYNALQNRFPYFQHLSARALSSWKSSIRHALNHKLFKKVLFRVTSINGKGVYWSIQTSMIPQEWHLEYVCQTSDISVNEHVGRISDEVTSSSTQTAEDTNTLIRNTSVLKDVTEISNVDDCSLLPTNDIYEIFSQYSMESNQLCQLENSASLHEFGQLRDEVSIPCYLPYWMANAYPNLGCDEPMIVFHPILNN